MKLTRNVFTIADLTKWIDDDILVVNRDYQRGSGLWPLNARSYFIDTILNGFPFPKVTIRQTINLKTKKTIREIIDGQQRLTAIHDFVNNKIALSSVSKNYGGMKFIDLEDEDKEDFLAYEVSVDTVIAASEEEILEVFRRMNSYTVPLNDQEKRHATYQGEFKWFIKDMADQYNPMFEKYRILTFSQINRMADADLMTELCQILLSGIETRSQAKLNELYKSNDRVFHKKKDVENKLTDALDYFKNEFRAIGEQKILRGYSMYSLFSALVYNKWGIMNVKSANIDGLKPIESFSKNTDKAIQNISELMRAVDLREDTGNYGEFVKACLSTTQRLSQRMIRLKWFVAALQDKL